MTGQPNAELAYNVLDYIRKHPEQHDQGTYVSRLDTSNQPGPLCGTVACFAGWTCLLSGDVLEFSESEGLVIHGFDGDVHDRAEQLLGLEADGDQSFELFLATQNREDLPRVVAEIFGPRPEFVSRHGKSGWANGTYDCHDACQPGCPGEHWAPIPPCHPVGCFNGAHQNPECVYALPVDDVPPNAGSAS
ncbi:hypothetical protein Ait01nite_089850 [Actinoplanes italicus]|uniref:Uncharacterized protein n=1 Tax=Actinoplanes italicus TaxID=113567 RepID=A0A2T0JIZ0_9ACTN|nr:hypothetical protein [Actinoplanes italicus]PRX07402.1 hypothetical protein CLV67_14277 [Actinoplanes italicus]GIE35940.1 hypothetical protein Ait01nite_089850 [Actinoplanes italicus]